MEAYGSELKETPYPLVAALGTKELQTKVLHHIRTINEEFVPKLNFISLPLEHRFPVKKEIREKHGTFPNQTQRDFDGYKVQGILKARWLKKHHELLPSVVLLFYEYDPRLQQKDWLIQETVIRDEIDQLKRGVSARECRILLIFVQQIDDLTGTPTTTTDERLASLRKRLETDSKTITLVRAKDLTRSSNILIKLESAIRNYSLEYYKAQSKRVKRYKKSLNKTSHQALLVRYNFKIAHYYEFRRYTTKVLENYEAAYRAITALPLQENASIQNIGYFQVKTMAEYINFKLCYHLLFSSNNIKSAVEQLHRHMKIYGRALGPVDRTYEHWEWMSRQYHVFAQLLSEAVSKRGGALPSVGLDSDVYKEPYLYYVTAAKYATYRRKAAAKLGLTSNLKNLSNSEGSPASSHFTEKDFFVIPSVYVGGEPVVSDTTSNEPSSAALTKYRHSMEVSVPHSKKVIFLLEQSMHFLSTYVVDQRTHRNRLKHRLLVQLGIERLALKEYQKARADLQRVKNVYAMEHWWAQTAQLLKQLTMCAFLQGDTSGFIDFSLQLLSPNLEEYVSLEERQRIQESLIQAWRQPASLGPPFHEGSSLKLLELPMNRSGTLFDVQVQFDKMAAYVKEQAVLHLNIKSHFPTAITLSKLELFFNDERYNICVEHREQTEEFDWKEGNPSGYLSLKFHHQQAKVICMPLHIIGGRPLLRYKETRFHYGKSEKPLGSETDFLSLILPCDAATVNLSTNPRPYLADGRAPVMGKGPGSPSFAKRKSVFSLSNDVAVPPAIESLDFVEEDGSGHTRGTAVVVLQPRPKATVELHTKSALLTGDFRDIFFRIKSNKDMLQNLNVGFACDPVPSSSSVQDAFFYSWSQQANAYLPLRLDPSTIQPNDRLTLNPMQSNTEQEFSLTVRSMKPLTTTIILSVSYTTKSGVAVSFEQRFEVECKDPFRLTNTLLHDFPNPIGAETNDTLSKESTAITGKDVNLQALLACSSIESLEISSILFENSEAILMSGISNSGFFTEDEIDEKLILNQGDTRGMYLRFIPQKASSSISLGKVIVRWKRVQHSNFHPVYTTTSLDLQPVSFVQVPVTLDVQVPPYAVVGDMAEIKIHLVNNGEISRSVCIKPSEESDFLIVGRTNFTEDLLPMDSVTCHLGLIPVKTGYLRLPKMEVTLLKSNTPLISMKERRELFVLPQEHATSKSSCIISETLA